MNKFIDWIDKYEVEFTWFYIGLNLMAGVHHFGRGQWAWILFSFTMMVFLIATYKKEK
jgi:hypothetical protein